MSDPTPETDRKETLRFFLDQTDKANARLDSVLRQQAERDGERDARDARLLRTVIGAFVSLSVLLVLVLAGVVGVYVSLPDGTTTRPAAEATGSGSGSSGSGFAP